MTGLIAALILSSPPQTAPAAAPHASCQIAHGGQAALPVVLSPNATAEEKRVAGELAEMLKRITGATFTVKSGDGAEGIVLGTAEEFGALAPDVHWNPSDLTQADDCLLRTTGHRLLILGAGVDGVRDGVWTVLQRVGCRQYFPGPLWEVVPHTSDIDVDYDANIQPSFFLREFGYAQTPAKGSDAETREWLERNRLTPLDDSRLATAPAYDEIVERHRAEFAAHPDWLGKDAKKHTSTKFRFSSLALRRLIDQDALTQSAAHPDRLSISMTPSDGEGWVQVPPEANLGSVTDRVVGLASEVAAVVRAKYPDHLVGLRASGALAASPGLPVGPGVVVDLDSGLAGAALDDLLKAWKDRAPALGIRAKISDWSGDGDLPGRAEAASPATFAHTLAAEASLGARHLSAEADDAWAPDGLGYYIAAQTLWDTGAAAHAADITNEFLKNCFGTAKDVMASFYALIDGDNHPLVSDQLAAAMNAILLSARAKTTEPQVLRRIDALRVYTGYISLYLDYRYAGDSGTRTSAGDKLMNYADRARGFLAVDAPALAHGIRPHDRDAYHRFLGPATETYSASDLEAFGKDLPIAGPEIEKGTTFTRSLVPAPVFGTADDKPAELGQFDGRLTIYTLVAKDEPIRLTVKAGLSDALAGPAKIVLIAPDGTTVADHAEAAPDKAAHDVVLHPTGGGTYLIRIDGGRGGTTVTWPSGPPMAVADDRALHPEFTDRFAAYFFVPTGTHEVVGYSVDSGDVFDSGGHKLFTLPRRPEIFRVPVPPGQDGHEWEFRNCLGIKALLNVPPYLAHSPQELLVPAEASK